MTGIELPAKDVNSVCFNSNILTKNAIDRVEFYPTITVGTVVLAAPVEVHAKASDKPRIDGFMCAKNGFSSGFMDGHKEY